MVSAFLLLAIIPLFSALDPKKWIADGIDKVGPKSLQNITLPGTQNSGTYDLTEVQVPGQALELWPAIDVVIKPFHLNKEKEMIKWSRDQAIEIKDQLEKGIRYFDFKLAFNSTMNNWFVYNNMYGTAVQPMLQTIADYLKSYDKEIVVVELSHFTGSYTKLNLTNLQSTVKSTLGAYMYPVNTSFNFTVNDMIKAGKRAVVTMELEYDGVSIWPGSAIKTTNPNVDKESLLINETTPIVEEYNSKLWPGVLYKMSWVLEPTADTILHTLLPWESHTVEDLSDHCNKHLPKFWEKYEKTPYWRMGNILVIDFNEKSDIFDVVMKMNGIS